MCIVRIRFGKLKERVAAAELLEQQAYCGNKRMQNSASALDRVNYPDISPAVQLFVSDLAKFFSRSSPVHWQTHSMLKHPAI